MAVGGGGGRWMCVNMCECVGVSTDSVGMGTGKSGNVNNQQ